jgi:hypothetical protein
MREELDNGKRKNQPADERESRMEANETVR